MSTALDDNSWQWSSQPATTGGMSVPVVNLLGDGRPQAQNSVQSPINPVGVINTIANNASNIGKAFGTDNTLSGVTDFADTSKVLSSDVGVQHEVTGAITGEDKLLNPSDISGTTVSLSNMAVDAGASIGGNFLANKVFGSNRGEGASIGGTVGGIAGSAIGGPIGGAVGSFLGNFVGGLFGGGQGTQAAEFSSGLTATGQLSNLTFGNDKSNSGEQKFTQGFSNSVSQTLGVLGSQGVDLSKLQLHGGYNTVQAGGGFIDVGLQGQDPSKLTRIKFNSGDGSSVATALNQLGDTALSLLGNSKKYADYVATAPQQSGNSTGISSPNDAVNAAFANAPTVGARAPAKQTQFSQFVDSFKQQQKAGAVA